MDRTKMQLMASFNNIVRGIQSLSLSLPFSLPLSLFSSSPLNASADIFNFRRLKFQRSHSKTKIEMTSSHNRAQRSFENIVTAENCCQGRPWKWPCGQQS